MSIHTIACIGSGLIGQGWATIFASKGFQVRLQDQRPEQLETALRIVEKNLQLFESKGLVPKGQIRPALERIMTTKDLAEAMAGADYVQENTHDTYPVKKEVFKALDGLAPADAILASSSSGLLMSHIQTATNRPERCLLVHPFLPIQLMPLVEIAGGNQTSARVIQATRDFMESLGKTPVVLKKEVPGYIVNRLQAALLREAMDLVERDVADPEDIETAFRNGMGLRDPIMGPLLRAYLAGNGMEQFFAHFAESYRSRLEDMANWTAFPESATTKLLQKLQEGDLLAGKTLEELKDWRDRCLIDILQLLEKKGVVLR